MASANLFLDKSRTKDGQHPVCIRICHLRKQWLITLKATATVKDFIKALAGTGTLNDHQKELRENLLQQRQKAQSVLDKLDVITKDTFNQAYYAEVDIIKIKDLLDIESQFTLYATELMEQERVKSARFYKDALRLFLDFRKNIALQDIDTNYLSRFESYMKATGRSKATASMYLRALRSIFNRAIKRKVRWSNFSGQLTCVN